MIKEEKVVEILLIHKCCHDGLNLLKQWHIDNPNKDYNINSVGIFNAKEYAKQYNFDLNKDLPLLIIDNKIYKRIEPIESIKNKEIK